MEKTRLELLLDAVNDIALLLEVEDKDVLYALLDLENTPEGDLIEQALKQI